MSARIAGPADRDALHAVRHEVFVLGQGVPPGIERDDRDAGAVHAVAELDGAIVGTGRLVADHGVGIIGRMAVLARVRGRGVGRALLSELEGAAAAQGLAVVELHAQLHARGFYERAGYQPVGEPYLEAGIEHLTMRKYVAHRVPPSA